MDLYDATQGITLGELTLVPGGLQAWGLEHDTYLGRMAERAQARLWRDLAHGRPVDLVQGEHAQPSPRNAQDPAPAQLDR